jgi:hypothetical protein
MKKQKREGSGFCETKEKEKLEDTQLLLQDKIKKEKLYFSPLTGT